MLLAKIDNIFRNIRYDKPAFSGLEETKLARLKTSRLDKKNRVFSRSPLGLRLLRATSPLALMKGAVFLMGASILIVGCFISQSALTPFIAMTGSFLFVGSGVILSLAMTLLAQIRGKAFGLIRNSREVDRYRVGMYQFGQLMTKYKDGYPKERSKELSENLVEKGAAEFESGIESVRVSIETTLNFYEEMAFSIKHGEALETVLYDYFSGPLIDTHVFLIHHLRYVRGDEPNSPKHKDGKATNLEAFENFTWLASRWSVIMKETNQIMCEFDRVTARAE